MKSVSWQQLQGSTSIRIASVAFLLLVLLATARSEKVPAGPDLADRVLLADFTNDTAEPALGRRLGQVLKASLEQSPHLMFYPNQEIQDSLRQMVLNPFAPMTADIARHICISEKIPGFLLPRVTQPSGFYVVSVQLVTVKNGSLQESLADTVRAQNEADLVSDVEDMGRRIRRLLGEDQRSPAVAEKSLFSNAARIPPVLQLFTEAADFHARSEYAQEIPRLEAAITLDPGFALAQSRLASIYAALGWTVPALEHASLAKANADEAPPKERHRILGIYYQAHEDCQRAREQYEALAELYPRSWEVQLELSDAALSANDVQRAISACQESIRLNQWQPEPYLHLCRAHLSNGNTDAARRAWQQAFSLAPENSDVIAEGGLLELADNNLGAAMRAFQQIADNPDPIVKTRGVFLLAQAQAYGGRMQLALATLQSGIEYDRLQNYGFFEADKRLTRAEICLLEGNTAFAVSECRLVPDLHGDAMRLGALGRILARARQLSDAAAIAAQLEQNPSSALSTFHAAMIRGEVALASGTSDEGIRVFRRWEQVRPAAIVQESLARALASAGLWDQAELAYRRLSERKTEVLFPHDSEWFTSGWAQILFGHATCLAKLARRDEARQQFRSYLWVFDGADDDITSLQDARAFLRKRM